MNETASGRKVVVLTPVTVDWSPATSRNGNGHSGDKLSQTGEKQQKSQNGDNESLHLHDLKNVV